ncbi:MAG: hypothetical protein PHP85_12920, partial [Gallionella sp.]|nr:hypothetical protein [Gallionella sp.]
IWRLLFGPGAAGATHAIRDDSYLKSICYVKKRRIPSKSRPTLYNMEQSCATLALYELSARGHEILGDLCVFLLAEFEADKWLRLSAVSLLPATHLEKGLDAALNFIDDCDAKILEKLAEKVNDALRDGMQPSRLYHELVRKLGGK